MPIAEAFERDGEEAFRAREAEVVGELLEGADGGAIALGGGSVLSERVRAALERHIVVWLEVDAEEAWRRIAHSDRPLASRAEDVSRLLDERLPLYEELADAIVPLGDRGDRRAARCRRSAALDRAARRDAGCSGRRAPPASTRSSSGAGLLDAGWWPLASRRFCVTDTDVGAALRRAPRAARGPDRGRAGRGREDDGARPSGSCASSPAPG